LSETSCSQGSAYSLVIHVHRARIFEFHETSNSTAYDCLISLWIRRHWFSYILRRNVSERMECWSLVVANTSSLNLRNIIQSRGHGKLYLSTRFPHTSNGTRSFQIYPLINGGNTQPNPGPATKTSKHSCKECGEDAALCVQCNSFSHA